MSYGITTGGVPTRFTIDSSGRISVFLYGVDGSGTPRAILTDTIGHVIFVSVSPSPTPTAKPTPTAAP